MFKSSRLIKNSRRSSGPSKFWSFTRYMESWRKYEHEDLSSNPHRFVDFLHRFLGNKARAGFPIMEYFFHMVPVRFILPAFFSERDKVLDDMVCRIRLTINAAECAAATVPINHRNLCWIKLFVV